MKAYEPMTSLLFKTACGSNFPGLVVDVGAGTGHFSEIAANQRREVYALEPRRNVYDILLACAKESSFISTLPFAASDFNGQGTLYFAPERKYTASLKPERWKTESAIVEVRMLDKILFENKKIDLIKIDVEGAEPEVIRGAFGIIKRDRPIIFCEVLNDEVGLRIESALKAITNKYTYHRIYEDEMRVQSEEHLTVGDGWGNFMLHASYGG